jgi:hydroxyacylglutathione hydrolase
VRSDDELRREGRIPGALQVHVTRLPERLKEVPKDATLHVFCGSGLRSMVAASYLAMREWTEVAVILGGLSAWDSRTCPVEL